VAMRVCTRLRERRMRVLSPGAVAEAVFFLAMDLFRKPF
jgi:hypothetical protein